MRHEIGWNNGNLLSKTFHWILKHGDICISIGYDYSRALISMGWDCFWNAMHMERAWKYHGIVLYDRKREIGFTMIGQQYHITIIYKSSVKHLSEEKRPT